MADMEPASALPLICFAPEFGIGSAELLPGTRLAKSKDAFCENAKVQIIQVLFLDAAKNSYYTADKSGRRSKRMEMFVYAKRSCDGHCSPVRGSSGRT